MSGITYAIGDIHGRLDLLERAAEAITAHLNGRQGRVICLGDYVDRGPESRGVIEFLMQAQGAGSLTCLKGNHEDLMIKACRGPEDGQDVDMWVMNGGWETLKSYGGRFQDVPEAHLIWLESLPTIAADNDRIYVHAGIMPGVPAVEQEPEVCMWIRERFLRADAGDLEKHVVHGHTHTWACKMTAVPELLPHRTNLDTGAFHTGILVVAVFEVGRPEPVEVLEVTA